MQNQIFQQQFQPLQKVAYLQMNKKQQQHYW